MTTPDVVMFAHPDLSGMIRGKTFAARRREASVRDGLAWVPANLMISPLGAIPADNPFGPTGEIQLRADDTARVVLQGDGRCRLELMLCDILDHRGDPWLCCPRTALKAALAALEAEAGLRLKVAFEHEFTVSGGTFGHDPAFSPAAIRRAADLAVAVDDCLQEAGIELEQFVPEFAAGQFEISSTPKDALRACDEAILCREVIRDAARTRQLHASFLPKPRLDQAGNGVHLHFSLWTTQGAPATGQDGWLTPTAGAFASGLVEQAAALMLFTTGSANSFLRIRPRSWVGAFACVGTRNREAMIRFCPRSVDQVGSHPNASLEFRVIDATANIYLALAAIIRAGLDGIRRNLASPPDVTVDPAGLSQQDAPLPLPGSLTDALARADGAALLDQFPALLKAALLSARRADAVLEQQRDPAELAAELARIY